MSSFSGQLRRLRFYCTLEVWRCEPFYPGIRIIVNTIFGLVSHYSNPHDIPDKHIAKIADLSIMIRRHCVDCQKAGSRHHLQPLASFLI